MGHAVLNIGLLGPLEVREGDRPIEVPRGRVRAMLAVLALSAGQPVPAEDLVDRVWGEERPADAQASLHTTVRRLRRLLGGSHVSTTAGGYRLDLPADAVDAVRFGRLCAGADRCDDDTAERTMLWQALALWRGVPFESERSEWLTRSQRPALVERRLQAIERLADLELAAGRTAELVDELQELAAEHPLRESLWARLLLALDATGRRADALAAYERVQTSLATALGVEPGADLRAVHAGLTDRPGAPWQVPADVADFTGRQDALRLLDERVPGAELIVVHGPGGMGKTAFAVHWAQRVQDRFPGGQLFVGLRGYGPGEPMDPAAALDMMLRGLGVPDERIPDGTRARRALLGTTLAGRRVLVVLDDARNAEQVRPLLAGGGAVVLVTSRSRLRGVGHDDVVRIGLDAMTPADATTFLSERLKGQEVSFDTASLGRLAALCGFMPLALTVAAERAGRYPDIPLADLVLELDDEQSRLDVLETGEDLTTSLRAVMSWSYRALDPEPARMFRLLGLHPGADLGRAAAAALAGVRQPAAVGLLERLTEAHLLSRPRAGRYAMHDLVRIYAAERSADEPAGDRNRAVRRLYRWYARAATAARATIWGPQPSDPTGPDDEIDVPEFADAGQAARWLASELHALPAVIAGSVRTGLHAEVLLVVRAIGRYVDFSHDPIELAPLLEHGLASARALDDLPAQAGVLNALGRLHRRAGDLESAYRSLKAAYLLYAEAGDPVWGSISLGNAGLLLSELGRHDEAIQHLEQAIADGRRYDIGNLLASALNNLAVVLTAVGRYDQAERAATEAIDLHRAAGLQFEETVALDTLGVVNLGRGDPQRAASCFRQVVRIRRPAGGWRLAYALHSLGLAQRAGGDDVGARRSWQEALRIIDQTGADDSPQLSRAELRARLAEV